MARKTSRPGTSFILICLIALLTLNGSFPAWMPTARASAVTLQPVEKTDGLLRNPAMGWVLYLENRLENFDLADFGPALDHASILYIRLPWAELEPQEGQYAWIHNQDFKDFVEDAREEGLKLALSVYVNAQDAYMQATPDFVRLAGADGTTIPFGRSVKGKIQSVTTTAGRVNGSIADILDNDESTSWSSGLNPSFPQYITFDFGASPVTSNKIDIVTDYGQGHGITNVDVEYWNGTGWTTAAANKSMAWGRNSGTEEYRSIQYPSTSATKVRLKVNSANLQYGNFSISEAYITDVTPTQQYWTPYEDDPVFRQKFEAFMDAFAAEFDDPDTTDFVDISGLGWWGEMHHLNLKTETEVQAAEWLTNVFTSRFDNVLLNSLEGGYLIDWADQKAINGVTAGIRRCSFASPEYMTQLDKDKLKAVWAQGVPVFAESNFQNYATWTTTWSPFYPNVGSLLRQTIMDAMETHANTLDMRRIDDARTWAVSFPGLVDHFTKYGGYRLVLNSVEVPQSIQSGQPFLINQKWKNTGVGLFPNKRPNWDHKYKVAYALLDKTTGAIVSRHVVNGVEAGDWIRGPLYSYTTQLTFTGANAGMYDLGVAIVDTTDNNKPSIQLAIQSPKTVGGWYKIGEMQVTL